MNWNLRNTSEFQKNFKLCPSKVKKDIHHTFELIQIDPFDIHLRTHRLRGRLGIYHSITINESYRIIVRIDENKHEVILLDIGGSGYV